MLPLAAVSKTVIQGIKLNHLAVWLALVALVVVIPALFNPKKFKDAMLEFANAGNVVMRLAALTHLLIAFLILNTHKLIDTANPRSIMAVLGYLIFLRGVVWLWWPNWVRERIKRVMNKNYGVHLMGFVALVFAVLLGYLGIWVY